MKALYCTCIGFALFLASCGFPPASTPATQIPSLAPEATVVPEAESCPPYTVETNLNSSVTVTGSEVDAAIQAIRSDSPLVGLGQTIVDVSQREGIHPLYIVAHAAWESTWGTSRLARDKNNLFGYRAYDSCPYECAQTFNTKAESIETVMPIIRADYLMEGSRYYNGPTLMGMNVRYATDQNWKNGIADIMNSLAAKIPNLCVSAPDLLQGTWKGPVDQPGSQYYTTILTLTECGMPDTVCGSVEYPELACGGVISFRYQENGIYYLHESITYGTESCVNEVDIYLEQISGSSWRATYHGGGLAAFEAILTKTD
jgi:hypothetical protein